MGIFFFKNEWMDKQKEDTIIDKLKIERNEYI